MREKVVIRDRGDALNLVGAIQRVFGLKVRKVQMEIHGKTVEMDFRKPGPEGEMTHAPKGAGLRASSQNAF